MCVDVDNRRLFQGWSRLRLHAASVNAAEAASVAEPTPFRVARVEPLEQEMSATTETAEDFRHVDVARPPVTASAAGREQAQREVARGSNEVAEVVRRVDRLEEELHERRRRHATLLVKSTAGKIAA